MSYDDILLSEYKFCTMCKQNKLKSEFTKCKTNKDGLDNRCKSCKKIINDSLREVKQKHYNEHKEQYIQRAKAYRQEHKEQIRSYRNQNKEEYLKKYKEYNETHKDQRKQYKQEHKESIRQYNREYNKRYKEKYKIWVKEHPEKIKQYRQTKQNRDSFKLRVVSCVATALQCNNNKTANLDSVGLVVYNLEQLKQHLESQFTPEMNWDNYGSYWELDHIIPQNLFNFNSSQDSDFQICWSLANLRPLTVKENRSRPRDGSDVPEELKQQIMKGE